MTATESELFQQVRCYQWAYKVTKNFISSSTGCARPLDQIQLLKLLLLPQGVQLHQQQNLAEAEQAYRAFLRHNPNHADCLHQLGALLVQQYGAKQVCKDLLLHQPGAGRIQWPQCFTYLAALRSGVLGQMLMLAR